MVSGPNRSGWSIALAGKSQAPPGVDGKDGQQSDNDADPERVSQVDVFVPACVEHGRGKKNERGGAQRENAHRASVLEAVPHEGKVARTDQARLSKPGRAAQQVPPLPRVGLRGWASMKLVVVPSAFLTTQLMSHGVDRLVSGQGVQSMMIEPWPVHVPWPSFTA